jgi:cytochrome c oxidase assembly factor CtaG
VLLLGVAAPLIVLGAPWMSVWRPLPLGIRRATAGTIARSPGWAPLRALGRLLSRPIPVWIAFTVNLVAWHIPVVYDLALSHQGIHDLEHLLYLLFAILLWTQVLDSPPLRVRLSQINRVYYIAAAAVPGWIISLVLVFSSSPLYPFYAHLNHRPGGISALADQQIAGGMMLLPGSLAFTIYVFFQIYVWMGSDQQQRPPGGGGGRLPPPPAPPTHGGPPADVDDASTERDRELVGAGARGVEPRAGARVSTAHRD